MKNKIICGDCLDVLKKMPSECVDLIYLDPPFSSNRNYTGIWDKTKEELSFDDAHWELGIKGYIKWLQERINQCFRILKSTGSIYVHCDWHASHYIKVMIDEVAKKYGGKFRNEIIWCYRGGGTPKKDFAKRHDTIFRYSKSNDYYFDVDPVRIPYSEDSIERLKYKARSFRQEKIYDNYEPNQKGKHPEDWWIMQPIMPSSKERRGYPTQKPEKLLEKIILSSSKKGDTILDPFCGCGTTIAVASQLGRRFIGIDVYRMSIKVMNNRLKEIRNWNESKYLSEKVKIKSFEWDVIFPTGIDDIKKYEWRNFQDWVCEKFGALKGKRGPDGGIDGTTTTNVVIYDITEKRLIALPPETIIQSKHFKETTKVGEPHLKKFESTIRHSNKTEGMIVAWEFAKTIKQYVSAAKEKGISIYCVEAKWLYDQPTPKSPYSDSYKVGRKKKIDEIL